MGNKQIDCFESMEVKIVSQRYYDNKDNFRFCFLMY